MIDRDYKPILFNSSLEAGVRSLAILHAAFPTAIDLQRLVEMDYLVVHSGDVSGPKSLHVASPLRVGELLVRRGLIEKGLLLMMSRGLVRRLLAQEGFIYIADEAAAPFISSLCDEYSMKLKQRAVWVVEYFDGKSTDEVRRFIHNFFEQWSSQFELSQKLGDSI